MTSPGTSNNSRAFTVIIFYSEEPNRLHPRTGSGDGDEELQEDGKNNTLDTNQRFDAAFRNTRKKYWRISKGTLP